jgi:hypothetical protein
LKTLFHAYSPRSKVQELEEDKRDLERQVNELKSKIEQIEKRNAEQRAVEEKKHSEEIQYLKKTNQQLKVSVERLATLGPEPNLQFPLSTGPTGRHHCAQEIKTTSSSNSKVSFKHLLDSFRLFFFSCST